MGKACVAAQLLYANQHRSREVKTARNHRIALLTGDRVGLTGQQRLVDAGRSADQLAIGGESLTGQNANHIARLQPLE